MTMDKENKMYIYTNIQCICLGFKSLVNVYTFDMGKTGSLEQADRLQQELLIKAIELAE